MLVCCESVFPEFLALLMQQMDYSVNLDLKLSLSIHLLVWHYSTANPLCMMRECEKGVGSVNVCVNRFINSLFLIPALTSAGQLFVVWQRALKRSPGLESPLTSPLPILSHRETGEPEPPKCQEVFNAASVTWTKPRRSRDEEHRESLWKPHVGCVMLQRK